MDASFDVLNVADQSGSPLLTLPAELRNLIWTHCLVQAPIIPLALPGPGPAFKNLRICPRLLGSCKQINMECTPILYGENTFSAHPSLLATLPACTLLRVKRPPVISSRVIRMIRRYYLHVRLDTDPRFTYEQAQESFDSVEELRIEVFQAMYGRCVLLWIRNSALPLADFGSCDFSKLKLFEGVRGVGKVVVYGSVGDGKYAQYLARAMMSPPGTEVPPYEEMYIGGNKAWDTWQNGNR